MHHSLRDGTLTTSNPKQILDDKKYIKDIIQYEMSKN